VSPVVAGPALAVRGSASRSVSVLGVRPDDFSRVIRVDSRIRDGRFEVSGAQAVIGTGLASELGVGVGDELRLLTAEGRTQLVEVRGVFELGNEEADDRWVIVSLRNGQTLLDLVGGVSRIDLRVGDVFLADAVTRRVARNTGLPTTSWTERNARLLVGLESQSRSSEMIQLFVVIAVAMGIASVLAVSVVQRRREIGILRAMGSSRVSIQGLFLFQGAIVGLAGSAIGSLVGAGLSSFFESLTTAADGSPLFPIDLTLGRFVTAMVVATITGLLAALLPARRAARLDPAVAIRSL
jgi:lipoprotein-releasing system permease protein